VKYYRSLSKSTDRTLHIAANNSVYRSDHSIWAIGPADTTILFISSGQLASIPLTACFTILIANSDSPSVDFTSYLNATVSSLKEDLISLCPDFDGAELSDISVSSNGVTFTDSQTVLDVILSAGANPITAARPTAAAPARPVFEPHPDYLYFRTNLGQPFKLRASKFATGGAVQMEFSRRLNLTRQDVTVSGKGPLPKPRTLSEDYPFLRIGLVFFSQVPFGSDQQSWIEPHPGKPLTWRLLFRDRAEIAMEVPWSWPGSQLKRAIAEKTGWVWFMIDVVVKSELLDESQIVDALQVDDPVFVVNLCSRLEAVERTPPKIDRSGEWFAKLTEGIPDQVVAELDDGKRPEMSVADALFLWLRCGKDMKAVQMLLQPSTFPLLPLG
jgi:hypothetical protein